MKSLVYILVSYVFLLSPAFAADLMYCGTYNNSYAYDAQLFESEFLNKTAEQSCKHLSGNPMCIKMHKRNVANYKAGKCKVVSGEVGQQLEQARRQFDRKLYYQIWNSI